MFNESNPPRGLEEMKARSQASDMLADMLAEIMLESNAPEEMKARSQASDMLADMLAETMLESNAPEEIKLGVRIIQQGKKVSKAAHEIIEAFAGDPATIKASDTETLKQVLEYLGLVEVGLKQFMETTKAQNANNAPNEI